MTIFLIIVGIYLVGAVCLTPSFTRRLWNNARRAYPSLYGNKATPDEIASGRRFYTAGGMGLAVIWPGVLVFFAIWSVMHRTTFAKDLEAEAELERAKLYAEAREIVRQADEEQERKARQDFNKELNS